MKRARVAGEAARLIRFGLVGVANTVIYYGLYLLGHLVLPYLLAHVIAFALATAGSFLLNCYFTFRIRPTLRKFLLFPLSSLTNFVLTSVGLYALVGLWHLDERIAPLLAAAVAVPVTFLVAQVILVPRTDQGRT
ncbi:GtrA family protein [Amycolatopsis cynarae]|uniref:GtrA family protein n=1 Tax=Amycolatopsis cynarae TaxID=2995223 RepID=A0ABY7B2Y4_9PSEU|nr:GtrA family protein [Amycolatopsis sp. HUAS 11-8]WAL66647.1 GtrA family protein [Amycolatopsis sp. HUAS 11-8]